MEQFQLYFQNDLNVLSAKLNLFSIYNDFGTAYCSLLLFLEKAFFMHYCICTVSIAPLRSSSADKSEMVSQVLFGETVEMLLKKGNWAKVRCTWDNYVGWMDYKQLQPIDEGVVHQLPSYALELCQPAMTDDHFQPLLLGSTLPSFDGLRFSIGLKKYSYSGQVITPQIGQSTPELIIKIARKYLFAPYLWGGRSPFGIDCSGLTQTVYKMAGIQLLRDASQQVTQGKSIDFIELSQVADLAYFENKKGRITHVGIILPDNQILHASGRVRIDRLDHYGIFNIDKNRYTHKLRIIKRYIADVPYQNTEKEVKIPENQASMF